MLWYRDYGANKGDILASTVLSELATFQTSIIALWGLLLNLVLIAIAFLAYKNFGVKKQFLNKQLDVVSTLSNQLSNLTLSNMRYYGSKDNTGKEHQICVGYTFSFFTISLGFDYSKTDLIVVSDDNIERIFPFLKHINNPLLPKTIADQLKKLNRPIRYSMSKQKAELPIDYTMLYPENPEQTEKQKLLGNLVYILYDKPTEFNQDSMELRQSILDWFEEYGAEDLNL